MTASLMPNAKQQYFTANGVPLSGGLLYTYAAGTTTPKVTYSDAAGTTPNANPVVLDSRGEATVFWDGAYKVVLKDSLGATIYTQDNVTTYNVDVFAELASTATGKGASLVGTEGGGTVQDLTPVADLTDLAALTPVAGQIRQVTTGAALGQWQCTAGSTPTDALNGLYKASDTSGYYWARIWDGINGKPEWFGAVKNSNGTGVGAANLAAINACIVLCPVTVLESADYWVNGKILSQTPNRAMQGVPGDGYNTGTGTRVISTSLTNAAVRFGPDAQPATTPEFMRGIACSGITFMHSAALTAPASLGDAATATATIERQWLFRPRFEDVNAWEPLIGFRTKGLIQPYTKNCKVLRTSAAAAGADFCWGLFLDGGVWASGLPGNPSYFDEEFACEFAPALVADKVGLLASGDFSDVFISKMETVNATSGVRLFASGTRAQVNIHVTDCVFDQCSGTALDVQSLAAGACVNISGGYYQSKATATAVIHARGTNGVVNITGDCVILGSEAGTTIGVYGQGQQVINIDESVSILECPRPVLIEGATNGKILCTIQNDVITGNNAAVTVGGTGKMRIAPTVRGKASAFTFGIGLVGTSQSGHTIDPTLVLASCIGAGATNKVAVNCFGTPVYITTPGYYTSAGASGTSGAGLHVTGITA